MMGMLQQLEGVCFVGEVVRNRVVVVVVVGVVFGRTEYG
jgi:hypothetical protein